MRKIVVFACIFLVLYTIGSVKKNKSNFSNSENSNRFKSVDTNLSGNNLDSLQIQEKWKWELDKNYSHVTGRVKNTSQKPIKYWKISAKFLDKNNQVINQEIDNSIDILLPNESDEFEIMTKHKKEYSSVTVSVSEIKF
jgi:hypothetical protein